MHNCLILLSPVVNLFEHLYNTRLLYYILCMLGVEPKASHVLNTCTTTGLHIAQPYFKVPFRFHYQLVLLWCKVLHAFSQSYPVLFSCRHNKF